MGVAISEILVKKDIEFSDLANEIIVIDAPLFLYQFLSTIRGPDGTPLTDSEGRITSHLVGLFFRTATLIKNHLRIAYVFDGVAPDLKMKERERRKELKEKAKVEYDRAVERHDIDDMKKFAQRTSKLDSSMIEEAMELIEAFGIPVIKAPSEAEAQASYMVKKGDAYAVATQDTDTLMFGATRVVRNLSIAGKRKKTRKLSYETYKPQLITLSDNMNQLGIDNDNFIALCMLVGTDFNVGGIKGLGPKKSLALVKKFSDLDELFKEVEWDKHFEVSWEEVFYLIKNMKVTDDYELVWKDMKSDKIKEILIGRHGFSEERVQNTLDKLKKEEPKQRGLNEFF